MSKRSRYTVSSVDDIVLSIISLVANTCSVVDLFLRYAAWDMGIADSNLELILFIFFYINYIIHCKIKRDNQQAPKIVRVPGNKTKPKKVRIKIYK